MLPSARTMPGVVDGLELGAEECFGPVVEGLAFPVFHDLQELGLVPRGDFIRLGGPVPDPLDLPLDPRDRVLGKDRSRPVPRGEVSHNKLILPDPDGHLFEGAPEGLGAAPGHGEVLGFLVEAGVDAGAFDADRRLGRKDLVLDPGNAFGHGQPPVDVAKPKAAAFASQRATSRLSMSCPPFQVHSRSSIAYFPRASSW